MNAYVMIKAVIMMQDEPLIRLVQITESRLFMDISLQLIVWKAIGSLTPNVSLRAPVY